MSADPAPFDLFAFRNSYARLPERFFARLAPVPVRGPALIKFNHALAGELGIDSGLLAGAEAADIFSGNRVLPQMEPVAMAYAGHQFGSFVPQLGDGRAILLGEVIDINGRRRDIHLKGSGKTPFSRGADGRSPLGPVMREYIVSEAMHALGIPTTRSLAAVATGETVYRETPLPGAVLTRIARSHIRVGTFEYFAARGDHEAVRILADHAIARLYPEIRGHETPYPAFLDAVMDRQASLVASWLGAGFVHGVMNTDNMAVSGETIDYGPCAFIDAYDPAAVFSSIDARGRYAYGNQGNIALWNLARFAECLLPLFGDDAEKSVARAEDILMTFPARFEKYRLEVMGRKLGLRDAREGDGELTGGFLDLMQAREADFTLAFRALCAAAEDGDAPALHSLLGDGPASRDWLGAWRARSARQALAPAAQAAAMRAANPVYIPRNHRIEQAIALAVEKDDFSGMETLLDVLSRPYEERAEHAAYALPPKPEERVCRTFCGT